MRERFSFEAILRYPICSILPTEWCEYRRHSVPKLCFKAGTLPSYLVSRGTVILVKRPTRLFPFRDLKRIGDSLENIF